EWQTAAEGYRENIAVPARTLHNGHQAAHAADGWQAVQGRLHVLSESGVTDKQRGSSGGEAVEAQVEGPVRSKDGDSLLLRASAPQRRGIRPRLPDVEDAVVDEGSAAVRI